MTAKQKIFWLRLVTLIGLCLPALELGWRWYNGDLEPRPVTVATHSTGDWAVIFLMLSLAMTPARALQYIVLPQAIRTMLPPITNFAIVLLKDTALVFAVGVVEIMALARNLVTETLQSAAVYLIAGGIYLCVTIPMARLAAGLERQRQAWQ